MGESWRERNIERKGDMVGDGGRGRSTTTASGGAAASMAARRGLSSGRRRLDPNPARPRGRDGVDLDGNSDELRSARHGIEVAGTCSVAATVELRAAGGWVSESYLLEEKFLDVPLWVLVT